MVKVSDIHNYLINELKPVYYTKNGQNKQFATVFTTGKKRLVLIGMPHTIGKSDSTRSLMRILSSEKPEIILVEKPADSAKWQLEASLKNPQSYWSESDWAIDFAHRHGIKFAGMDIGDRSLLEAFMKASKGNIELAIAFWIMLTYYSQRRAMRGSDSTEILNIAESLVVSDFLNPGGKFHHLRNRFVAICRKQKGATMPECVDMILRRMVAKYAGGGPVPDVMDKRNLTAPYPFEKRYRLSRISAKWHAYRDKAMIDSCISALRDHDKVVAIAGFGHIIEINKILEKEIETVFGKARSKRLPES